MQQTLVSPNTAIWICNLKRHSFNVSSNMLQIAVAVLRLHYMFVSNLCPVL